MTRIQGKENKANVKQREEEVNKTRNKQNNERERDKWLLEWKKEIREELQLKHNRSNQVRKEGTNSHKNNSKKP